jgi:hypothetical protein
MPLLNIILEISFTYEVQAKLDPTARYGVVSYLRNAS